MSNKTAYIICTINKIKGMITTFPQCSFSLEFPETLSQNNICHHSPSVSGIPKKRIVGYLLTCPIRSENAL